jgi:hypothetical protein
VNGWRVWLRSVRGQLTLLGATFVGAVALAVAIVCLRGPVFERYVREKYPAAGTWAQDAARELTAPETSAERLEDIRAAAVERTRLARETRKVAPDLEELYGLWVSDPDLDPHDLLAVRLTRFVPDWVLGRLQRTLAAGNPEQRGRALRWLRAVAGLEETADRVRALAVQAQHRAAVRGEEELRRQAESVLASGRLADGR